MADTAFIIQLIILFFIFGGGAIAYVYIKKALDEGVVKVNKHLQEKYKVTLNKNGCKVEVAVTEEEEEAYTVSGIMLKAWEQRPIVRRHGLIPHLMGTANSHIKTNDHVHKASDHIHKIEH